MKNIIRTCGLMALFLSATIKSVNADPETGGCLKASYKSQATSTYQIIIPLDENGVWCQIDTIKETFVTCSGSGNIVCCPGITDWEVINSQHNVKCP